MKNHAGEPVVLQRGEAIPDNMGNPIVHGRVLGRETGIIVFCLGTCVPFFPLIFFYFIFFLGGYHLFMRIVYKIKLSEYPCNGDIFLITIITYWQTFIRLNLSSSWNKPKKRESPNSTFSLLISIYAKRIIRLCFLL